jgi:hypothetical protein
MAFFGFISKNAYSYESCPIGVEIIEGLYLNFVLEEEGIF